MMEKVQEPSNSECYTPLSEPFTIEGVWGFLCLHVLHLQQTAYKNYLYKQSLIYCLLQTLS
jgi:hypothetical protein